MSAFDVESLAGLVEADETVIGGFEPGAGVVPREGERM